MFNVTPLKAVDWIVIILSTSFVLWVGEAYRWIRRR
jgi:Ca2+-transporting ATPase